uniref:Uncharacterized protein n=1 Tax=Physcomitrium patens TaxID=3218 RepID=A0A2K1L7P6_PHYPA|nr:hypothetical protein PHYPA_000456 [Physcomitrium patens]
MLCTMVMPSTPTWNADQEKCQTRIGLGDLFSTSDVMGEDHHDVQVHLSSSNSFSIVQAHILSIPCFYYVVKW